MWPGSVEISKQGLDCPKWGGSNSSTISDSNPWHAKDSMTSGWGSVNQSPVPNAGTEGWSTALNQQLQQNNANGSMLPQQLESRSHSSFTSNHPQQPANTVWGTNSGAGPAGAWSRGNPMANSTNQASTSLASNQTLGSGGPSSWAEAVANKQSSNNATSVGMPGGSSTSVSTASSQPTQTAIEEIKAKKTQEELIAMAINSNEGWGKTVIRQDTAWIIDDPPAPNEASHKDSHLDHDQHSTATLTSKQIITGTAIWESLKTPQKPAEITTPWETGKTPAVIANGPTSEILSTNQQASFRQTTLDNKVPSVNWPIQASTNSTLATSTINWGSVATAGGSSSDISWGDTPVAPGPLKKEEERPLWTLSSISDVGSKSSADLGISPWERNSLPLHRSSSTGSWIEETTTSDMVSGGAVSGGWNEEKSNPSVLHEIDDGTSLWGDPGQNKPQMGWRPGSVLPSKVPTMRKSESEVFNSSNVGNSLGLKLGFGADDLSRTWNASLPPPCTESSGWGSSELKENWMGLLNHNQRLKPPFRANNDINDWSALSNNRLLFDKGQPPQRSALLQKLTNMGFKKEEAQAALISNNMNYDEAMTMLLKAKVPGNSLVLDHSLSSSSTPAQGRFNLNSARTLSGGMEDVLGMDNGTLDLIGLSNLSINSNSSGINGINSSLVNQLRGSAGNAALHQFASSLGNPNLDFSALLTSGPVIPQLQTPKPLAPLVSQQHSRPMPSLPPQQSPIMQQFIQCVQSAVQLGLLPPQAINQHSLSNPNFCNNLQILLKLYENQKLLLQTIQQGPPPGHNSSSVLCQQQQQHQIYECTAMQQHIDTLKQQLVQMAGTASNSVSAPLTSSSIAPSSRLISQWKVSDGGTNNGAINSSNDINRLQHSTSLLEQSDSTATSSTWLPMASTSTSSWLGDVSASNGNALNDQKPTLASSTVTTTTSAQTSSLSDSNSASAAIAALDIEEFVPGKPWQGPGTKNVEDDPYLTPGSITRNSISSVKDSQAASILGKANYPSLSCTSGLVNNTSSNNLLEQRAQGSFSSKLGSQWIVPDSKPSDLWPGQSFTNKSGMGQWNPVNRSISWASGDRADNISSSTTSMSNNWSMSSPPSNWLLIKSIPQVDTINLQNLCHQYGTITSFTPNFYQGQSLVFYARAEDALKAYRGMNACRLGNSLIKADFISDAEVGQVVNKIQQQQQLATPASGFQQANNGMMGAVGGSGLMGNGGMLGNGQAFFGKLPLSVPPGGDPSLLASLRAPPHWGTGLSGGGMMGLWNNATSPGGQQSLWGGGIGLEDHDHNVFLPGDLLGNQ